MIYAQIKNNVIQNIIVLEDSSLSSLFASDYDYFIEIDNLSPVPGIGWSYDGTNFSAPIPPSTNETTLQIAEDKIQKAINGFNDFMIQYAAQNVLLGITQSGKTQLIADTLSSVMQYGQTGSLYAVISALQAITPTDEMAPFLTSAIITNLIAETETVLSSL